MSTAGSICGLCSALVLTATAHPGMVKVWTWEELAKAAVLAVARVESVTASPSPTCYKDRALGVSGYPMFPRLERGQIRVFPLKREGALWGEQFPVCGPA